MLPLPDFVVVRIVGRRDLHAAGAQFGLGPHVGHQAELAGSKRQHQLAAGDGHVAQLAQLRQQLPPAALATSSSCRLKLRLLLVRGIGQPVFAARRSACPSAAAGSGCTATAVSPSMVSGRVVAMVTCVGSPGPRIDHRIAEVPEMALHRPRETPRRR